ncbi:MAG: hypothetical protein ACYDGX_07055 [Thermoleophilia bacterium]
MSAPAKLPRSCLLSFFFLLLVFFLAAAASIDTSCLDAADSAYLISASAIAHGAFPYRDFLAAHPPLLYLLGAPLALFGGSVEPFRIFSLVIQCALALAVLFLAMKLAGKPWLAFLAGAFTLVAPAGVFFSKMFLNDSLTSLLSVAMFLLLLGASRRSAAAAGAVAALGVLTKLTFLPVLAAGAVFALLYRRSLSGLFLAVVLGVSSIAAAAIEFFTGGAYFDDIFLAQGSKTLSFANFYQGMERIWQFDWPLLLLAVPGVWFCLASLLRTRRRAREAGNAGGGESFALPLLWLGAGLLPLATLPAAGHDINLFQTAEPAVALMAAWGVVTLAGAAARLRARRLPRQKPGGKAAAMVAVVLIAAAAAAMLARDRDFLARSNSADVDRIVAAIEKNSSGGMPVLAPGCYAFQAARPVAFGFYDQFLWEEKYQRGDADARALFDRISLDIDQGQIAAVALSESQPTYAAMETGLKSRYRVDYRSTQWPPLTLWLPGIRRVAGGG